MTVVTATKPLSWEEFKALPGGQVVHIESKSGHCEPFNAVIVGLATEVLDPASYPKEDPAWNGIAVKTEQGQARMLYLKEEGAKPGGVMDKRHIEEWYSVTTTQVHVYKHTLGQKLHIILDWLLEGGTVTNIDGHVLALSENYDLVAEGERLQLGKGADQKPEKVYMNTFCDLGAFIKLVEKLPDELVSLYAAQTVLTRHNRTPGRERIC